MIAWKENWEETKQHFIDWWNREGLVVGMWGAPRLDQPREETGDPGWLDSPEERCTQPAWRAQSNHYGLARSFFPLDTLPIANTSIGPGSLALLLGSRPGFSPSTVWYHPVMEDVAEPETLLQLTFDPENRWWRIHEATLCECVKLGQGKYMTGCPDLIENIDILASLRDTQTLLMDMIDRPEWVSQKVLEINQVWFEAYQRIYDIIKLEDGSSAFGAFALWGPGKTAKVQCDAAAMFSADMFARFVVPALAEQCAWLDHSMFHLDGHECIPHLDLLLNIPALDAIEWTPDPNVPPGGDSEWYPMYRKILEAGKSVQAVGIRIDQIEPLIKAVGHRGLYIMTEIRNQAEVDEVARIVKPYLYDE